MKRYVDMKEISDGRFYDLNDMVKADCRDCTGCSACCQGMGASIILDPYDMHRLSAGLGLTPEELLSDKLERFFLRPYETGRDFYEQFYERLEEGGNYLAT